MMLTMNDLCQNIIVACFIEWLNDYNLLPLTIKVVFPIDCRQTNNCFSLERLLSLGLSGPECCSSKPARMARSRIVVHRNMYVKCIHVYVV